MVMVMMMVVMMMIMMMMTVGDDDDVDDDDDDDDGDDDDDDDDDDVAFRVEVRRKRGSSIRMLNGMRNAIYVRRVLTPELSWTCKYCIPKINSGRGIDGLDNQI